MRPTGALAALQLASGRDATVAAGAALAAGAYFMAVFALGFVLGTVRVLVVTPYVGAFAATVVEAPVMVIAAVGIWGWVSRRAAAPKAWWARWIMVAVFLAFLVAAETGLGAILFGSTASQQWAALTSPAGFVGLGAQLLAALVPVLGRPKDVGCAPSAALETHLAPIASATAADPPTRPRRW